MAGGVALLVGAFIINSTISVVLAQRTRELALLRCLGAEARQLRRMVRGGGPRCRRGRLAHGAGRGPRRGRGAAGVRELRAGLQRRPARPHARGHTPYRRRRVAHRVRRHGRLRTGPGAPREPGGAAGRVARPTGHRPAAARTARMAAGAVLAAVGVAAVPFAALTGTGPVLLPAAALTLVGVRMLGPCVATGWSVSSACRSRECSGCRANSPGGTRCAARTGPPPPLRP